MNDHPLCGLDLTDPAIIEQYERNAPRRIFPVVFGCDLAAGVLGWTRRSRDAVDIVRRYEFVRCGVSVSRRSFGSKLIRNPSDQRAVILVSWKSAEVGLGLALGFSPEVARFHSNGAEPKIRDINVADSYLPIRW